ncbi:response regulator [Salinarimonas chemoclinalis]|uniref:response regulator n=1 Tax=Salinarimonas chemoclinalis TaxID=3241599 RepID=UPI003556230C
MRIAFENLSFVVAEDDPFWRRLVVAWLEACGARSVRDTADGARALALMREAPADVVVTDWEMPGLDGIALTKALRDRAASPNAFVPILMLTAYGERGRVMRAMRAGVNGYLVKPVTPRAFYERLLAVLADTRPFVATPHYFGPDRSRPQALVLPQEG